MTNLTHRQHTILLLLYRYRFLNRQHIQTLLNHQTHSRTISWLNNLVDLGYIAKMTVPSESKKPQPTVYTLTRLSLGMLRDLEEVDGSRLQVRLYKERQRSLRLMTHCLHIADLAIGLRQLTEANAVDLRFLTKVELLGTEGLIRPTPDAFFALTNVEGEVQRYLLDLFDTATPRFALRSRVKQYIDYSGENTWQEKTHQPFPRVIFLCPDQIAVNVLKRTIIKLQARMLFTDPIDFSLAIWSMVVVHGLTKDVLHQVSQS